MDGGKPAVKPGLEFLNDAVHVPRQHNITKMQTNSRFHLLLVVVFLMADSSIADADTFGYFSVAESKPLGEFWLNPGFLTYHFQKNLNLNDINPGVGAEYRYSTTVSVTAGRFYNSDRHTSRYVGWYWQPAAIGRFRAGAVVGAFDGYPFVNNGAWFPVLIPVVSIEYRSVGASLAFVPTYQDKLHGAISVQFKVRLF